MDELYVIKVLLAGNRVFNLGFKTFDKANIIFTSIKEEIAAEEMIIIAMDDYNQSLSVISDVVEGVNLTNVEKELELLSELEYRRALSQADLQSKAQRDPKLGGRAHLVTPQQGGNFPIN